MIDNHATRTYVVRMPYTAEQRRRKRAEGRCYACLCRMAEDGKTTCRECRPKMARHSRNSQARRRARGVCISCGVNELDTADLCVECMERRTARRNARVATGVCAARAQCNAPPVAGLTVCENHWFATLGKGKNRSGLGNSDAVTMLRKIWDAQGGTCALTGRKLVIGQNASLDHIVPVTRGGTSDASNLRFVVRSVNVLKLDLLDDELLELCADVLRHSGIQSRVAS